MASTTKMMTAILAVEYAGLDEIAVVSKNADRTPEYTIGLRAGQQLTVGELLKVALIRSSNDAAVVLAEHVAGDESFFAYLMTKKAFAIGAMETRFKNASGLPDPDHYSTAYNLALIGSNSLSKPYIAKLVATAETDFKHPGYRESLTIRNTNGLLRGYTGADGIKTGTADASGKCLVASATRNNRGLIAVVLKSGDREGDCRKLLDYGFNNTSQQKILDHETSFKNLRINGSENTWADIVPAEDLWLWLGNNKSNIEKKVRLNYNLEAPLKKGQVLGELDIYVDGGYFKSIALVSREDIDRQSWYLKRIINGIMKHTKINNAIDEQ
jgi:D-alanyl-D-alanine carboxypeptidase (penicillin-binding protein 5/6)